MKLTKRSKQVRAVAIVFGIWIIFLVATHLWWTGSGYCWGSLTECVKL